jgi:hypothetical protein
MPRQRTGRRFVSRSINLPRETWEFIDRAAHIEGISCSAWLRKRLSPASEKVTPLSVQECERSSVS